MHQAAPQDLQRLPGMSTEASHVCVQSHPLKMGKRMSEQ